MLKRLINFLFVVPSRETKILKVHCDETKCTFCGNCQRVCPENAIRADDKVRVYYSYRCNRCKACIGSCNAGALAFY